MEKLVVVIPTYNEARNIEAISAALFALNLLGLEILIVDDHSPDGTGQIADSLAERYAGRFHVLHRSGKLGLGAAYIAGFRWALDHGAQFIVQMDADFSHPVAAIPEMRALAEEYDVVVGSRYVKGGRLDQRWGLGRRLLSWWANSVWVRLALGVRARDATAGFKCWRASALQKVHTESIRSNGYIFQVEMCYVAEKAGLKIKEIPIYFEDRRIGQSKMDMRVKLEAAIRIFAIKSYHKL